MKKLLGILRKMVDGLTGIVFSVLLYTFILVVGGSFGFSVFVLANKLIGGQLEGICEYIHNVANTYTGAFIVVAAIVCIIGYFVFLAKAGDCMAKEFEREGVSNG